MSETIKCKKQYSSMQKQILLDFVEQNPEIIKQKISNQYTSAHIKSKWEDITCQLNAVLGVHKSWKEWRKCWSDIKCRTKKKHSENIKHMTTTGGGPKSNVELDPVEDRILTMMGGNVLITGHTIPEPGLPILIDIQDENAQPTEVQHEEDIWINTDHTYDRPGPMIEIVETTTKESNNKKVKPPINQGGVKRKTNLKASIQASNKLIAIAQKQAADKEKYYDEKIKLLKKEVEIKERIASALEKLVEK